MKSAPTLPPNDSLDVEGVLGLYACAITVMEGFYESVARGQVPAISGTKRVAQRLVSASASGSPRLRALVSLAAARRSVPERAVQSAILVVLAGRQASDDRAALSRLAESALLIDSGSVLLAGRADARLPADLDTQVPASTAMACLEASGTHSDAAQVRATLAFEAAWLERAAVLGPLKSSAMGPLLGARLIVLARSMLRRLAPPDGRPGVSPPEALRSLAEEPDSDPLLIRLLVGALGAVPVGTVVELDSGEWAVVTAPPADPTRIDKPRVRVVTDTNGRARQQLVELDLALEPKGSQPLIERIVPPDEARFNVAAALFV